MLNSFFLNSTKLSYLFCVWNKFWIYIIKLLIKILFFIFWKEIIRFYTMFVSSPVRFLLYPCSIELTDREFGLSSLTSSLLAFFIQRILDVLESGSSLPQVFYKRGVLRKISQNSQENTCARVSGLQLYYKRDPGTGVLLWILWNFPKNTSFIEHLWWLLVRVRPIDL